VSYRGTQRTDCPGYIPPPFPAWILGIVAAVVVLLGVVIGLFMWFRRRQSKVAEGGDSKPNNVRA
jgi:flagellar basal body-associated protein FliL